jgi:excinuclease ABC subunit A
VDATENNLQNVTVGFPIGLMTCVTGVSGSGKSTLVNDVLCRALFRHFYHSKEAPGAHGGIEGMELLDKAIVIDQTPIGRTPRSNPLTYTGAFNAIRDLFSQLPSSRVRGYEPGRFSFNVKGGRCEHCEGDGVRKIEMNFLPPVYVTCEVCGGRRFNRETLEITYKGLNIADVLEMTVDDGLQFFRNVPAVADKLESLASVGLGYLRLGQHATTLSGGEAQRVKLAAELAKRATGRTIYIRGEHAGDHRAPAGRDQMRGLRDRSRAGRRLRRRQGGGEGDTGVHRDAGDEPYRPVFEDGAGVVSVESDHGDDLIPAPERG